MGEQEIAARVDAVSSQVSPDDGRGEPRGLASFAAWLPSRVLGVFAPAGLCDHSMPLATCSAAAAWVVGPAVLDFLAIAGPTFHEPQKLHPHSPARRLQIPHPPKPSWSASRTSDRGAR